MYKTVITFKNDISADVLQSLRETAEKAFDNRIGKAVNVSKNPYQCIFEGDEDMHCSLQHGNYLLHHTKGFLNFVEEWQWVDLEYPDESHCMLEAIAEIEMMRTR